MRFIKGWAAILGLAVGITCLGACVAPVPPNAVFVANAPPAAQVEVIGTAPGPNYVWVRGYYRWDGAHYNWGPGRWEAKPHADARWVDGSWAHHSKGYYWQEGRWK